MAARKATGPDEERFVSWVDADRPGAPVERPHSRLRDWLADVSWVDVALGLLAVAVYDLVGILVVSGWQTARCGTECGLRTQLHLMQVALVLSLVAVVLPPVLLTLVIRRGRLVMAVAQAALCLVMLLNAVSTEHRLVPRINGTAPCWNPLYSDSECPWGPKD
ncbi:MAG: hypothetical protein QOI26_1830 [Pseudonocardiales bacterium]|nr:hypothetical protein [Pseudonocardiales bacterium]